MGIFRIALLILALASIMSPANADVMSILDTSHEPPNSPEGILRPTNGMSMEQVRQKFGNPGEELAPVGEPPITRWVYDQYTVYFEHNLVIHSVIKH
jgi:hypothetical protein